MVPNRFIENGIKKLKPSEFQLMIVLLYLSQRFSTDKFYYTDREIIKRFGLSQASISRARLALKKYKLIEYKSGFSINGISRATRYRLLPTSQLRRLYRIKEDQKDKLSKPP